MQARSGRVKTDVPRHDLALGQLVEPLGVRDLMNVAALVEQLEESGAVRSHDDRLASCPLHCYTVSMQFNLVHHPSTPPADRQLKVWASVDHAASLGAVATTNIWFGVGAPAERFVIPEPAEACRTDELWRTTCFEAFLQPAGKEVYREWNFAPSGQWAAYDFGGYRSDMVDAEALSPPYIRIEDNFTWWSLGASIAVAADTSWQLGLSCVLEESDGTKSYWALAHPFDKPDFHAPGCFTAHLP